MENTNLVWIYAERNSSSDEAISVNEVVTGSGELVHKGQYLFELEGAKAVFEVEAEIGGYFYPIVSSGSVVEVGATIGLISSIVLSEIPETPVTEDSSEETQQNSNSGANIHNASKAAINLASKIGFDLSSLSHLSLITEADVEEASNQSSSNWNNSQIEKILILGSGPHATLVYEVASMNSRQRVIGVLDDSQNLLEEFGVPLLGNISESKVLELFNQRTATHIAIGVGANMKFRSKWNLFCSANNIPLSSLIHPQAMVSPNSQIASGCLVMDSARIGPHAVLETNVFVSAGVNIEHHCVIGMNTTFGPGVQLSGGVQIGENCGFGTQVGIEPSIQIGNNSQIASGSIITSNIPDDSIVKMDSSLKIRSRNISEN